MPRLEDLLHLASKPMQPALNHRTEAEKSTIAADVHRGIYGHDPPG